ncbi:tyrosine-type recombinase/integrase [Deferribacterales bacterium Es71-Z0220]|jgi:integrase|uniref:tyrosine-type recombinase/integrase n=1 Tax=Deferrivibrio essentukiensis TaxID=2880922 RepID=UPI001F603DC0|nr:site-specific integrase [Deferrivibrio essentukiensis]MCB4204822.1 tyrosine-type recombinase/integrase [Deferrivibrio essentukiensis]
MAKKDMSEKEVKNLKPSEDSVDKHRVSEKLYIYVYPNWKKKWYYRQRNNSDILIGEYPIVSYAEAFTIRDEMRNSENMGMPLRREVTVDDMFNKYFDLKSNSWSGYTKKRKVQIYEKDIKPILGNMEIQKVTIHNILKVIKVVEDRDALHTLEKVVVIIKNIFNKACSFGYIKINPASELENIIKKPVRKNYAALTEPEDISTLVKGIDYYRGNFIVKMALKFLLLTAQRSFTVRAAKWKDIDLENAIWNIPAEDMKMKTPLRLPLSKQAVELLKEIKQYTGNKKYVFYSFRSKKEILSENTFNTALRRIGFSSDETVAHGFRASFMTCMAEMGFPVDVLNLILDHKKRSKIEAAYNRSEKFEDKKIVLQAWADYLDKLKVTDKPSAVKVKVAKTSVESYSIIERVS